MSAPPTRIINIYNFIFPQPCHNTIINITQCNTRYNIKNANKSTKSYVLQTNLIYKTLSSNLKEISFTTYQKYRSLTTTVFFIVYILKPIRIPVACQTCKCLHIEIISPCITLINTAVITCIMRCFLCVCTVK